MASKFPKMSVPIVGVDLDNTIIDYGDLALSTARALAFTSVDLLTGKRAVRDALRSLPDGEMQWQRLQAEMYGPRIAEALPFPGVLDFIQYCCDVGIRVVIVSHKTEFASAAPAGTNLRDAARAWLCACGIVGPGKIAAEDVFFVSTRAEKVERIAVLGCSIFIDDLVEVFAEPEFPSGVQRWLFAPEDDAEALPDTQIFTSWPGLQAALVTTQMQGEKVLGASPVRGGRNSRVFHVQTFERAYALKSYPDDGRDRISREVSALRFIHKYAPDAAVPHVMGSDARHRFALFEWIGGSPISSVESGDIDEAAKLLALLHDLRGANDARALPAAMEACTNVRELFEQIRFRRERLQGPADRLLASFLTECFDPVLERATARQRNLDPDQHGDLPYNRRTLSPADFGYHNALRAGGRLIFLDFEYFGWDDPVKTVSDFLLHPGMHLALDDAAQFRKHAAEIYGVDPHFQPRLQARFPLFALRWALIVLNEFLPAIWAARVAAGISEEWGLVKQTQMNKARALVAVADAY